MQSTLRSSLLTLLSLAAWVFAAGGCGAAAGGTAESPHGTTVASEAVTVDEALRELDEYERQLEALYGPLGPGSRTFRATDEDASPALDQRPGAATTPAVELMQPAPQPGPDATDEGEDDEDGDRTDELSHDSDGRRCHVACRALSSMRRATDRLCSLAGEHDDRCARARTRVTVAATRVEADCEECEQ